MKLELYPFENNVLLLPNLQEYEKATDRYLTEDVFISFMEQLYATMSSNSLMAVCLQPMYQRQSILETFIHIDLTNMTIRVPHKAFQYINEVCPSVSLIIVPIKIHLVNIQNTYSEYDKYDFDINNPDLDIIDQLFQPEKPTTTAHSNLLLIDNDNKTIEYFEPHGLNLTHTSASVVSINNIVYRTVLQAFPFVAQYSFTNASNSCIIGVQTLQNFVDGDAGHCLAWSLFFLLMRLLNHKLSLNHETLSEYIHRFLVSLPAVQLDDMVRRFITYVKTVPPLTEREYSNYITLDINSAFSGSEIKSVEARLSQIAEIYFKKLLNSSQQNISILFTELMSYKSIPTFHQIMSKCMRKVLSSEKEKILYLTNNQLDMLNESNNNPMFNPMFSPFDSIENELYDMMYNAHKDQKG